MRWLQNTFWKRMWRALALEAKYLLAREQRYQPAVEQYPDIISSRTSADLFPRTKGFLRNDLSVCTGCGDCLEVCSVRALSMDTDLRADGSVQVNRFAIDLGRCYSCSACVDVCPVQSITHTPGYEGAVHERRSLVQEFSQERKIITRQQKIAEELRKIRSYEVRR